VPTATPIPPPPPGIPPSQANATGPIANLGVPSFRAQGKILDAATGLPLPDVCVYTGPPAGCPRFHISTDSGGNFSVDLPSGVPFGFVFERPGFKSIFGTPAQTVSGVGGQVATLNFSMQRS
jgi:hypothetical protein